VSKRRIALAFLIAPLTAPTLYWATASLLALGDPGRALTLDRAFSSFALVLLVGGPIAYAATAVVGVPACYLVQTRGGWRFASLLVLGAGAGIATAFLTAPYLRGELFSVILTPLEGAALGCLAAAVFWWLGRPRAEG
jgi:hypothetical protein